VQTVRWQRRSFASSTSRPQQQSVNGRSLLMEGVSGSQKSTGVGSTTSQAPTPDQPASFSRFPKTRRIYGPNPSKRPKNEQTLEDTPRSVPTSSMMGYAQALMLCGVVCALFQYYPRCTCTPTAGSACFRQRTLPDQRMPPCHLYLDAEMPCTMTASEDLYRLERMWRQEFMLVTLAHMVMPREDPHVS
jgi:hypothetical protein